MILILSAEVVGASMDATARFLQQSNGGSGMGVFQVCFIFLGAVLYFIFVHQAITSSGSWVIIILRSILRGFWKEASASVMMVR